MTVPTNAEGAHFRKSRTVGPVLPLPDAVPARRRTRGLLISGVVAVGLGVVALVLAFPRLAAPIGTAAGVVAVLVPLIHRAGYDESSDRGSGG
ncbi:hypothetical protein ABZY36_19575 [Streptomyces sp. NPDC006627]|uniref:hypothetical protein n=1 Tax=Streptomyces sp. NPDC006627 TaxID=3154679 RepID=UPI0033A21A3E